MPSNNESYLTIPSIQEDILKFPNSLPHLSNLAMVMPAGWWHSEIHLSGLFSYTILHFHCIESRKKFGGVTGLWDLGIWPIFKWLECVHVWLNIVKKITAAICTTLYKGLFTFNIILNSYSHSVKQLSVLSFSWWRNLSPEQLNKLITVREQINSSAATQS